MGAAIAREASSSPGSGLGGSCGHELEDIFRGAGTISLTCVRFLSFFILCFFEY